MSYILKENLIKKGEQILVIKANNNQHLTGAIVELVAIDNNRQSFAVKVISSESGAAVIGQQYNLYNSGPADEYIKADKKSKIKYYTDKLVDLEADRAKYLAEIEFLEKYDTMEDFVADKIGLLLKADSKESRVAILKTLKQTNFL